VDQRMTSMLLITMRIVKMSDFVFKTVLETPAALHWSSIWQILVSVRGLHTFLLRSFPHSYYFSSEQESFTACPCCALALHPKPRGAAWQPWACSLRKLCLVMESAQPWACPVHHQNKIQSMHRKASDSVNGRHAKMACTIF
jgi:hypothetical protein